ncbi:MAG: helix-hairpin-helix domain-containing protein [Ferruginibacter sp.]|nr:helix-hairpin-helix domain-containing protein [Ferruginibacter sp.]
MQSNTDKNFLSYTKKEARGIIFILLLIAVIFVCAKYVYPLIAVEKNISNAALSAATDSLLLKQNDEGKKQYSKNDYNSDEGYQSYPKKNYNNAFTGTMFYFDPNTLDVAGWQKLGIKDKTIASMQKYLSKGGRFKEPDDLRKVWGLRDDEKERLIPYVRIAGQAQPNYTNNNTPYEKKNYEKKAITSVDINSGDSSAFDALPGIGGGFSRRIINFRNKLGGFYKVEQVAETFGLPDSVFQKIKPLLKIISTEVKKLNVNTAKEEELKAHPYIRWQLAKVITEYKKQHGDFKTLEDLKKIMVIDAETYNKIAPDLTI